MSLRRFWLQFSTEDGPGAGSAVSLDNISFSMDCFLTCEYEKTFPAVPLYQTSVEFMSLSHRLTGHDSHNSGEKNNLINDQYRSDLCARVLRTLDWTELHCFTPVRSSKTRSSLINSFRFPRRIVARCLFHNVHENKSFLLRNFSVTD